MAPHLAKCLIRKFCKGLPIFEHTSDNGRILFAGNEQQIATVNKRLDELLIKKLAPRLVAVYCDVLKEEGIYED